jgi:hypothetical protein
MTMEQYSLIEVCVNGGVTGFGLGNHHASHTTFNISANNEKLFVKRALVDLAEGGYVIDKRPLEDHPNLVSLVWLAPLANGRIEGNEIQRFSAAERESAAFMANMFEGDFQCIAKAAAAGEFDPDDQKDAGGLDYVSASYLAYYWFDHGARIGKRKGNKIIWSDGEELIIEEAA